MFSQNNPSTKLIPSVIITTLISVSLLSVIIVLILSLKSDISTFDENNAYNYIKTQLAYGARIPGSVAHNETIELIKNNLSEEEWSSEIQEINYTQYNIKNIIGKRGEGRPWLIIGTHYDTRIFADRDLNKSQHSQPVPGANDGASGVGVLLELARVLPENIASKTRYNQIWLVFFDAEDNGEIADWDWILGSQAFVSKLDEKPDEVVVIDMIGDADLNIYMEGNSDNRINSEIWETANSIGYADNFIPTVRYHILDDHMPFIRAGIPAVDIIDFDYEFWHTTEDTLDKVSSDSLKVVGDTLMSWISTP